MIAVAVIGILASIAYPSYTQYVMRGHRAAAQTEMMDIANRQQQFLLANRAYVGKATLEASGYSLPGEVSAKYDYAITVDNAGLPSFTITFTPTGTQSSDGTLVLTSEGVRTRAGDAAKW
jgi:type IV pilus assembly protein PilE